MVSEPASSAIDCGFGHRPDQTKNMLNCYCCLSSKHAVVRRKSKDCSALTQVCPSGAICLSAVCLWACTIKIRLSVLV
jgi:hypothetical protein